MAATHRSGGTTGALKDLIVDRRLKPGDPMPTENELVDLVGVSRSNLREAVRTLVALDILEVRHGTGTFVGQLSLRPLVEGVAFRGVLVPGDDFESLREVVEIRAQLDHAQAPRIVESLAAEPSNDLRVLAHGMVAQAEKGEPFAELDRAFHLGIAALTGNRLYGQLVTAFWDIHTTVAPSLGLPTPRDIRDTAHAHVALLDAAESGDLEAYREAIEAHYAPLARSLEQASSDRQS